MGRTCAMAMGVTLTAAVTLGGEAASAHAATLQFTGDTVTYYAGPGETNDVRMWGSGVGGLSFQDTGATIHVGRGCIAHGDGGVVCGATRDVGRVRIYVRDGNDTVYADSVALPKTAIYGGRGNDTLHSGAGAGRRHVIDGGWGDDVITGATNQSGRQVFTGGPGNDRLYAQEGGSVDFSGGGGSDTLRVANGVYSGRLDGGNGDDTYAFGALGGGQGDQFFLAGLIVPGPGMDTVIDTRYIDLAECGSCVERVVGTPDPDIVQGSDRTDVIETADGNDVIEPRGGADTVAAGAGDDTILARDGVRDLVACGDGSDRAVLDDVDATDGSCEDIRPVPGGGAQFEPPVRYPAGDGITALAAADFDSDGAVDVLVRDAGGGLTIHPGDGHGALGQVLFASGPGLSRAAPVDGDPIPDLLDVEPLAGELIVKVRIARGDGDFGPVISSPGRVPTAELREWAPADADGDGRVDLVVATGSPGSDARLWIAPGRGDGSFERWREAGSSPATKALILVPDINGDGRPELVLQDDAGSVWISRSEGDVAFAPPAERAVGSPGSELGPMVVGRFEPGGPTTLAVTDQTRRCIALVRLEEGTGGAPDCFPAGGHVEGLLAVDLDGDDVTDLVHGTASPHLGVLYGRLGGLSEPDIYPVAFSDFISGPLAADLDADGRPDVIAVANLRMLAVFHNIGGTS